MRQHKKRNTDRNIHYDRLYHKIAEAHGVLPDEVRNKIQETIDAGWSNPNEEIRQKQRYLFPKGKPTVEEFIGTISEYIKAGNPLLYL